MFDFILITRTGCVAGIVWDYSAASAVARAHRMGYTSVVRAVNFNA